MRGGRGQGAAWHGRKGSSTVDGGGVGEAWHAGQRLQLLQALLHNLGWKQAREGAARRLPAPSSARPHMRPSVACLAQEAGGRRAVHCGAGRRQRDLWAGGQQLRPRCGAHLCAALPPASHDPRLPRLLPAPVHCPGLPAAPPASLIPCVFPSAAYPELLDQWIQSSFPGAGHVLVNSGMSGTTSGLAASCTDDLVPQVRCWGACGISARTQVGSCCGLAKLVAGNCKEQAGV